MGEKKQHKTSPLGGRHVNRCPSLTENNSLTQTFVFEAEEKRSPGPMGSVFKGFQKYLYDWPQVKTKRRAAIGRGKVKHQRRSRDVNRSARQFNGLELPNYVALQSRLESGVSRLSIIPQSENNVRRRMYHICLLQSQAHYQHSCQCQRLLDRLMSPCYICTNKSLLHGRSQHSIVQRGKMPLFRT